MEATPTNIKRILSRHPLSECDITTSGWDNITDMVDTIFIYPHRKGKYTGNFKNYIKQMIMNPSRSLQEEAIN